MKENNSFYVNQCLINSDCKETQLAFYLSRPKLSDDGKVISVTEEQVLINMNFDYAKILRDALDENIKKHETNLLNHEE